MTSETKPVEHLGWANCWDTTPPIVVTCRALQHVTTETRPTDCRSGTHTMKCDICRYEYKFDTSD